MEQIKPNLCINCTHYSHVPEFEKMRSTHRCNADKKINLVDGQPDTVDCERRRAVNGNCKPEGLLFIQRTSDSIQPLTNPQM